MKKLGCCKQLPGSADRGYSIYHWSRLSVAGRYKGEAPAGTYPGSGADDERWALGRDLK